MGSGLVNLGDVRVAESSQDLRLVLEAAERRCGGDTLTHDLHRHRPMRLILHRLVHDTHTTGRDDALEYIMANALSLEWGRSWGANPGVHGIFVTRSPAGTLPPGPSRDAVEAERPGNTSLGL